MIPYLGKEKDPAQFDFARGTMIPVDKPVDWTSFDVVAKLRNSIRRSLGVKKIKVGHSGTLDPFATGLLLICTGKATKELTELTGKDKVYTGKIRFDGKTPTYDLTSEVTSSYKTDHLDLGVIKTGAATFVGLIDQQVPAFSAVKKDGKRLYKRARAGEEIDLPVRKVEIYSFEIMDWDGVEAGFRVHCGKGTYIRSLANDLGAHLGSGGYLTSLRRTAIGEHTIEEAWPLMKLVENINGSATS